MHGPPCYRHVQTLAPRTCPKRWCWVDWSLEWWTLDTMATDAWSWTPMHVLRTLDSHMHSRIRSGERDKDGASVLFRGRPGRHATASEAAGEEDKSNSKTDGRTDFSKPKVAFSVASSAG